MALVEACRLAHDDDGPRLVWADAVGGERGELVVLQCDLASRATLASDERELRQRRADELIAAHGGEWAGDLARFATRWELRRGFLEAAEIDARRFVYETDAIFHAAPLLVSLRVTGLGDDDGPGLLHELVTRPQFWQLTALELVDPAIADLAVEELLASAALPSLRALGLAGITPRAAHALVASRELAALDALRLVNDALGDDALIAIARALPATAVLSREICADTGPLRLL
jgi:hypothetical protein